MCLSCCHCHQVIKANDDLTPEHHQFFLYQMLRGLKYIHSGETACWVERQRATDPYMARDSRWTERDKCRGSSTGTLHGRQ